jgi:hypothetical protein
VPTDEGRVSVVVTLVHGTFGRLPGRDAAWTRDGSFLRRRLEEELGGAVAFLPFRWSGMNWPSARYRAAHRLRDHFRTTAERYPERSHYVVAHSHGGNVVLYALRGIVREASPGGLPAGVVCLSTPFIAAQPRPVTLLRFVATYTVVLVTLFAVVAAIMGRLLIPWMAGIDSDNSVLNALVWNEVWAEFVLCAVLAWHATSGLVRLAHERRTLIAVDGIAIPVRIYRSIGDEATAVLVTSALFTWLGTLAWRAASALTIVVTGVFATLLLGLLAIPVGVLLLLERIVGGRGLWHRLTGAARSRRFWALVVTAGTMLAFAVWGYFLAGTPLGTADRSYATVVAVLALAVVSCSALSGLGYGLTAPFLEVSAETTPTGSWQVHLFAARTWDGDEPAVRGNAGTAAKPASLSHSAAYGDSGVLGAIAAWIREREAASETARSRCGGCGSAPDAATVDAVTEVVPSG